MIRRAAWRPLGSATLFVIAGALVGCSGATTGSASVATPQASRLRVGDPLPDVFVAPLDGEVTSLRGAIHGKVAVIDLWATWCTACAPVSARAKKLAAAVDPERVVVLGIDQGEDGPTVSRWLEGRQASYPIYLDPELALSDALGVRELPTVLVVDADGRIRRIDHGVTPEVVTLVESLSLSISKQAM